MDLITDFLSGARTQRKEYEKYFSPDEQEDHISDAIDFFWDWRSFVATLPPHVATTLHLTPVQRQVLHGVAAEGHTRYDRTQAQLTPYPLITIGFAVSPHIRGELNDGIIYVDPSATPLPSHWRLRWRADTAYPLSMNMATSCTEDLDFIISPHKIATQDMLDTIVAEEHPDAQPLFLTDERFTLIKPLPSLFNAMDEHKRFNYLSAFRGQETGKDYHVYAANGASQSPRTKPMAHRSFQFQYT